MPDRRLNDTTARREAPAAASTPHRTRRDVLDAATGTLAAAEIAHPRRNAEWLLANVLDVDRAMLYAYPTRAIEPAAHAQFQQMVARRTRREPLQYILGYESFYGLRIRVTPDVLIPRPETEQVVEAALCCIEARGRPRVLDVGTGSGCIALALQHERSDANVYACDVSTEALAVARGNARHHDLAVQYFRADLLSESFAVRSPASLDLVVSNPPYIPDTEAPTLSAEVRDHEPAQALFTGADALRYYRVLVQQAPVLLTRGGWLVLETHAHYAEAVRELLTTPPWSGVRVQKDWAGRPRMVIARYEGD